MRADQYLTANGYYESRARAQAAIKAGLVRANGKVLKKSSDKIPQDAEITAQQPHPWVSRAGIKLAYGLECFEVDVAGATCLDVGASTGGFTDVLLHGGAAFVYAVDVGQGQLHESLHGHPRIKSMESLDARALTRVHIAERPQIVVCDASFISLIKLLGPALTLAEPCAQLVALVKPQFEVGKAGIGRGGMVKSSEMAQAALIRVQDWIKTQGWQVLATDISPIKGGSGNQEFLLYAVKDNHLKA